MTIDREPPRLRTLKGELPDELLLALQDTDDDNATPAELAALVAQVSGALRQTSGEVKRPRSSSRASLLRRRVAGVALTFALGATAGVVGSSAVFFAISSKSEQPLPSPVPPKKSPSARLSTAASALPEVNTTPEPSLDGRAASARPAARESAQVPARNQGAEPSPEPSPESSSRAAVGSRDEFALLARAQAALAPNPGLALALASDHERKFPNGALVQERELVAINALLRLGRRAEASARAARFHRQFPTSVHGRRIDVLIGSEPSGVRK